MLLIVTFVRLFVLNNVRQIRYRFFENPLVFSPLCDQKSWESLFQMVIM